MVGGNSAGMAFGEEERGDPRAVLVGDRAAAGDLHVGG